jgi:chromosome partitioning protein
MIPHIIVLATSKGGAGKSTLARSLASYWINLEFHTAIVDADPQGSIIKRHDPQGLLSKLKVVANPEETIGQTILELKDTYKPIIVDTGGFKNKTSIRALLQSDFVLIPLKPSSDDMIAAIETYQLIKELNEVPERKGVPIKTKMILTMTQQGTVISKHIRDELQSVGMPLMKSEMYQRVVYPETAIKGLSPCITEPEGAAARDISSIIQEINTIYEEKK